TITRNKAIDFLRAAGRRPQPRGGSDDHHALEETIRPADDAAEAISERKLILRRALDLVRTEIEPRTWDAFWRVVIDETPPVDVAQALGVSVNVVYLARSRVLRRLADQFAQL